MTTPTTKRPQCLVCRRQSVPAYAPYCSEDCKAIGDLLT